MSEEIIYTNKYKLLNVELTIGRIDLDNHAWIEVDSEMVESQIPKQIPPQLTTGENTALNIHWFDKLLRSNTLIGTTFSKQRGGEEPAGIGRCSFIALSIAILCDQWFVAGIQYYTAVEIQSRPQPSSYYITTFNGVSNGRCLIQQSDIVNLITIHKFVCRAFQATSYNERIGKLIGLFIRVIIKKVPISTMVLKSFFPNPLSGEQGTIANASIFFEHVFTITGWMNMVETGIKKHWNKYFPDARVVWEDIKIIQKYRTTLVHDEPNEARKYVIDWQRKYKVSDHDLIRTIERKSIQTVKLIMRTIALNYDKYLEYRESLPK